MPLRRLLLISALVLGCPGVPVLAPPLPAEVWVDGSRGAPGDGTQGRPYRSVQEALGAARGQPLRVHVALGLYAGPLELPEGVELLGEGKATVLHASGPDAVVVRLPRGGVLKHLVVQGGGWGLEGAGTLRLEGVHFSGQRQGSVRLGAGHLVVEGGGFEAGVSETVGMALEGSVVQVRGSLFEGPYRRAVQVRGAAEVELLEVRFRGPVTAVHQIGGRVRAARVHVEGGRGPGLYAAQGALRVEDTSVVGHEYGLQAREAELEVRGFSSVRAARAGLGLVGVRGRLEEVVVQGSGDFGGVQLVGSDLEVRGLQVEGVEAAGVTALQGRLQLRQCRISRVGSREGDAGNGLELREVQAEVEGLEVREVAGVGVLGAQAARVVLRDGVLAGCRRGAVVAEQLGEVEAVGLEVVGGGGPVLAVTGRGVLRVDALRLRGPAQELLWAECRAGARVLLGRIESERGPVPLPVAPCVGRWQRPR